jgi:hypothetical protein
MPKDEKNLPEAVRKPAAFGPDLDLGAFEREAGAWRSCPVSALPRDITERALGVGVKTGKGERAGTYFQIDHSVVFKAVQRMFQGKVEIMSTGDALERYPWVEKYWWKLVDPHTDKYTALASSEWDQGYFIRILEGQRVTFPLQACLFISKDKLNQNPHNLIIAEPGSEAQIITGCTVHPSVRRGLHVGISEFCVKRGAKLTFTMVHDWAQDFDVRPRSAAILEDEARFVSNYICLRPVRSLQMFPTVYCRGVNSRASLNSILYGVGNSYLDVGSKVVLEGRGSRGEVITRAIATGRSQIYARGILVGENKDSRAHLECRGLLLSDEAFIHSIPELVGRVQGTELSHEAAVGKIAEEQVQYLMARGFPKSEAEALIIRGFMDVSILGLPEALREEIRKMVDRTVAGAL